MMDVELFIGDLHIMHFEHALAHFQHYTHTIFHPFSEAAQAILLKAYAHFDFLFARNGEKLRGVPPPIYITGSLFSFV